MPISVEAAQAEVEAFRAQFPALAKARFRVGYSAEDVYGPNHPPEELEGIKGSFDSSTPGRGPSFGFVAANHRDLPDFNASLRHEVFGHYGSNTLEPAAKRALLGAIHAARDTEDFRPIWEVVDRTYPRANALLRAEEVFCAIAEHCSGDALNDAQLSHADTRFTKVCIQRERSLTPADALVFTHAIATDLRDPHTVQRTFPDRNGFFRYPGMVGELPQSRSNEERQPRLTLSATRDPAPLQELQR